MAGDIPDPDFIDAVRTSAGRLGISPNDLLTAMSYETGGRLSPSMYGGAGGKYLGLIQFSPDNQQKYGVRPDQSAAEQMGAVESYLRDRGVKPGMGLLDTYSAINAGRPGLYNRSDAANGGAPGTVADKVATMAGHRMRANALLGGEAPAAAGASAPTAVASAAPGAAPLSLAPADSGAGAGPDLMAALSAIPQIARQDNAIQAPPINIHYAVPLNVARARAAAAAMRRSAIA